MKKVLYLTLIVLATGCELKARPKTPKATQPAPVRAEKQPQPAPTVSRQDLHEWTERTGQRQDAIQKCLEAGATERWGPTRGKVFLSEQKTLTGIREEISAFGSRDAYPESTRKLMRRADAQLDTLEYMLGIREK